MNKPVKLVGYYPIIGSEHTVYIPECEDFLVLEAKTIRINGADTNVIYVLMTNPNFGSVTQPVHVSLINISNPSGFTASTVPDGAQPLRPLVTEEGVFLPFISDGAGIENVEIITVGTGAVIPASENISYAGSYRKELGKFDSAMFHVFVKQ